MLKKISDTFAFGTLAIFIAGGLFTYLYSSLFWNPYDAWLLAWSVCAFLLWGLDKMRLSQKKRQIPRVILHGVALSGGFVGGWLGMFGFWHRIRSFSIWLILIVSTLLHGLLIEALYG